MSNIKPILYLNKHPKDYEDLSLVYAQGVQISGDLSVLENEKSIIVHKFSKDIEELFGGKFKIVGAIPCNIEIIFFVIDINAIPTSDGINCKIYRCNEDKNATKLVYDDYKYFGGTITGTFTYNSRNDLILAVSEYDALIDVPLKSFNIGTFEENYSEDLNLSYDNLSIVPTVKLPEFTNVNYQNGKATKGWYNFFIRFKFNKNDYTQWYNIGYPIFIGSLENINIFKVYGYSGTNTEFVTGFTDNISNQNDFSNETIGFILNNIKQYNPEYDFYQIAYVCSTTSTTLVKRTEDIDININSYKVTQENFNIEETLDNIVNTFYNYYDVKNIINYQNRLYIANYKEKEDLNTNIANYVNLSLKCEYLELKDSIYNLWNDYSQYFSEEKDSIVLSDIINSGDNTIVTLKAKGQQTGFYSTLMGSTNQNYLVEIPYIVGNTGSLTGFESHHEEGNYSRENGARIVVNGQTLYNFNEQISIDYISNQGLNEINNLEYIATAIINNIEYKLRITASRGDSSYTVVESNIDQLVQTVDDVQVNSDDLIIKTEDGNNLLINAETGITYESGNFDILIGDSVIGTIDLSNFKNCRFIDTNKSFQNRKLNDTLIPGEIYNFYIHYIDKFGEATRGYKINNSRKYAIYSNRRTIEVVPISLNGEYSKYIALKAPDSKVFGSDGTILAGANYITSDWVKNQVITEDFIFIGSDDGTRGEELISGEQQVTELDNALIDTLSNLDYNEDLTWADITNGIDNIFYRFTSEYNYNPEVNWNRYKNYIKELAFINITNSNNDTLFKIPNVPILIDYWDRGPQTTVNRDENIIRFPIIKLRVSNVVIPEGYIGYFISYEKQERVNKITGILTNADFINYNFTEDTNYGFINHNKANSENIFFYSSRFDIDDTIDINYSYINLKNLIVFEPRNTHIIIGEINSQFKYYNLNCPIIGLNDCGIVTRIEDYNVVAGGDGSKNRFGVGTALQIRNQYDLFDTDKSSNEYKFYYATLTYINKNIYTSTNKTLIKLSEIIYNTNEYVIEHGYNGYPTYDGITCYNANKVIMNTASTKIVNEKFKNYNNTYPIAAYFQFPTIEEYFLETKSFKNSPEQVSTLIQSVDDLSNKDEIGEFSMSSYVSPENSIDLYENKYIKRDDFTPKVYESYNSNLEYLYHFTKYIRRSNIIQDESLLNAWKQFPVEGYRVIAENKGIITNIIGIGTILLVHTEHSLFMFDRDNTLQTIDKSVQLQMPDIFDVDYKEVFTSDLGYGGLQDKFSAIVDQFGYIFYDESLNRLYKFDNGQLNYIDKDIINFLNQHKPTKLRFANDKVTNRLLIKYETKDSVKNVLSYNYLSNNFVSIHKYMFDIAYGTKTNLYMIHNANNNDTIYDIITSFTKENKYGEINYEYGDYTDNIRDIVISFIVNNNYQVIKYLEYITYKLYLLDMSSVNQFDEIDNRKQPYSGVKIRVYNDLIDTGDLDILIDTKEAKNIFSNYKKPHWDLGNWNFSYLRDTKNGQNFANLMSRLYGNYFVITFTLNNKVATNKIEFEDLNYFISKDKNI